LPHSYKSFNYVYAHHFIVGRKALRISEEAYKALTRIKRETESFTDAILRLTEKTEKGSLLDYVLTLDADEEFADELDKIVKEGK